MHDTNRRFRVKTLNKADGEKETKQEKEATKSLRKGPHPFFAVVVVVVFFLLGSESVELSLQRLFLLKFNYIVC